MTRTDATPCTTSNPHAAVSSVRVHNLAAAGGGTTYRDHSPKRLVDYVKQSFTHVSSSCHWPSAPVLQLTGYRVAGYTRSTPSQFPRRLRARSTRFHQACGIGVIVVGAAALPKGCLLGMRLRRRPHVQGPGPWRGEHLNGAPVVINFWDNGIRVRFNF